MKRFISLQFILLFCITSIFSQILNDSQIINPDDEVYTQLNDLQLDSKTFFFTQNTPISAGEMKLYLKQIEYDSLSNTGKDLYDQIYNKLNKSNNLLPFENTQLFLNLETTVESYYKTNENIPWTNKYFYKDNLFTLPINVGFGNYFAIQSDLFLGKNYIAMQKPNNFTNIPLKVKDLEFFFPTYAYGSTGISFDDWGVNLHVGKMGKTLGNTISGSIIYNSTFETDAYVELDLYSNIVKYTMDVVQLSSNRMDTIQQFNTERYMYIHQFDVRLFKSIKASIIEASMIANPFGLRFLNPLAFMHQAGGWTDYVTPENYDIYKETNFCAYFAYMLEWLPINNLRIYGLYSQIELQLPWERSQQRGRYYPNSFALQLGSEYNLYLNNSQKLKFGVEGVYTTPYMYIKQVPSSSLYRVRTDMQTKGKVYSWIGTPFGPDCLAGQFRTIYIPTKKLKFEFDYVLSAKGNHDFDIFKTIDEETGIYSYYPSVIWYLIEKLGRDGDFNELYKKATSLNLTGIPTFTNEFAFQATYELNKNLYINGKIVYMNVKNSRHIKNENEQGLEGSISVTYKLFD